MSFNALDRWLVLTKAQRLRKIAGSSSAPAGRGDVPAQATGMPYVPFVIPGLGRHLDEQVIENLKIILREQGALASLSRDKDDSEDLMRAFELARMTNVTMDIIYRFHGSIRRKLEACETALPEGKIQSETSQERSEPACRLKVDVGQSVILLDGEPIWVRDGASQFVQALIDAAGHRVTSRDMTSKFKELSEFTRMDRIYRSLDKKIRGLIDSNTHGYRLVEGAWHKSARDHP